MWRRRSWVSLKGKAGIPGQTEGRPATSIGPRAPPVGSLQQRVERAKRDGRWDQAYAPQRTATVPDDLQAALDADPAAAAFFATLRSANRYAVIYRVNDAKTAKTRGGRIAKFVTMLGRSETLHPRAGRASSSPTSSTKG